MPAERTILIIGKNGQIGWELCRTMSTLGNIVALDYPEVDLANPDSLISTIRSVKPSLIINAAAYTAVDKAESEPDLAMTVNGIAPGIIAEEAKRLGAPLVHYSTDYVYDGTKQEPYVEDDATAPLNVYGHTKLVGDEAIQAVGVHHFILRTSWIYGWRGHNFLVTMLRLAREQEEIQVVDDQVGTPNCSRDIAEATGHVVRLGVKGGTEYFAEHSGIYHLTASGSTSWYGFAKAIFTADPNSAEHKLKRLIPIASTKYGSKVHRPARSVLDATKFTGEFGYQMPSWKQPLEMWERS